MKSCLLSEPPLPAAADLPQVVATACRLAAGVVTCFHVTKAKTADTDFACHRRRVLSDAELEADLLQLTLAVPLLPTASFKKFCVHLPSLKCEA